MFEAAELGHKLSKEQYKRIEPRLRADLLDAQYDLSKNGRFPVIILISGVRGAGKGETVNRLNEWMDPRHIHTYAFDDPSDEERERPPMWRYWRALPPRGRIGILFGSWYSSPIIERVFRRSGKKALMQSVDEINRFERLLADEGALILKFWFHLSKKRQRKRLKELESDPDTSWRVTRRDWDFFKLYDRFYRISEETLRVTSTGHAPWIVIEGSDERYRSVTAGKTLLDALRKRLGAAASAARPKTQAAQIVRPVDRLNILDRMDLGQKLEKKRYELRMEKLQRRLALATRHPGFREREADWMRAYSEINDFEEELARSGAIVVKFWLQISKEEQLKRFKEREKTRFKRSKITPEDWRNRRKWDDYQLAAADMIERTATAHAPWTLVEANDKYHAREKILSTLVEAIEGALA